ncbi:OmpA family protein [Odoribacter sp. OttesenSCG-928-J03]|nr:OmpA family protein [Odoribacter sp. OttesenSCG-928-J03]
MGKYFLLLLLFSCFHLCGQTVSTNKKANEYYRQALSLYGKGEFSTALEKLEKASGYDDFAELYFLRADIYNRLKNCEQEVYYIKKGLALDSVKFSAYYFILGDYHFEKSNYAAAATFYAQYLKHDKRLNKAYIAKRQLENCAFALKALQEGQKQETELFISAQNDVYWPSLDISGKTILYTSLFDGVENIVLRKDGIDHLLNINTGQNEGTQSLTADGQMLYFTGCGLPDSRGRCDIYVSYRLADSLWSRPINLGGPVNTDSWEAQPAISQDGTKLYFASNRPGGKGKSDIWFSRLMHRGEDGRQYWSQPENLDFNTPGDEMAPFLYYDNRTLFFSSDGYPGMGGMDIYKVDLTDDTPPQNIGITVNTNKNEMGFVVDAGGKKGYFTSEREGKKSIYSYTLEEDVKCTELSYMYFEVTDESGVAILPDKLLVQSYNSNDTLAFYNLIGADTEMLSAFSSDNTILISVLKRGYLLYSDTLNTGVARYDSPLKKTIVLKKIREGVSLVLNGVFFDVDAYTLKSESMDELEQLLEFLNNNPEVKIEISGHTDNSGSDEYNRQLSENRAFEVYKYLFVHRIHKDRMTYKGYGKSKPLDSNATEEGRARNRRTEIVVK